MMRRADTEFLDIERSSDFPALSEVVPGVLGLTLPLPFAPHSVNVWLLEDGDGWVAIDCGPDTEEVRILWAQVQAHLQGNPTIRRIIATHGHVDHIGHAGPMWRRHGEPPFLMTRTEWLSASLRGLTGREPALSALAFYRRHGVPEARLADFATLHGALALLAPMPETLHAITDGDILRIGGRDWEVITTGGHAPDHAALHCAADRLLIAGDQILPGITPFVGLFASEPEADPLGRFLAGLRRMRRLDADTRVLPSHGLPFRGLNGRIQVLEDHHAARLDSIETICATPANAHAVAMRIFAHAMDSPHCRLALAETLAHLRHLQVLGRLGVEIAADGGIRYQRI